MVRNPTLAEDLTQETFLAVFRGLRQFRGQSAFTTWLHRVTCNTVLMCFRKKKLNETSLDEIAEFQEDSGHPRTEFGTLDRQLEDTPDRLLLQNSVAQLSRGFRAALLLHDVYGYQHREVAAMLGWATGTSKSQLHKARFNLRRMLWRFWRNREPQQEHSGGSSTGNSRPSPGPPDDPCDSASENGSSSQDPPRRRKKSIPGWCVPLDDDAPTLHQ